MNKILGLICVFGSILLAIAGIVFYILGQIDSSSLIIRAAIMLPFIFGYGIHLLNVHRRERAQKSIDMINKALEGTGYELKRMD